MASLGLPQLMMLPGQLPLPMFQLPGLPIAPLVTPPTGEGIAAPVAALAAASGLAAMYAELQRSCLQLQQASVAAVAASAEVAARQTAAANAHSRAAAAAQDLADGVRDLADRTGLRAMLPPAPPRLESS